MEDTLRGDATAAYSHARSAVMKPQSICEYKGFIEKISLHSPNLGYRGRSPLRVRLHSDGKTGERGGGVRGGKLLANATIFGGPSSCHEHASRPFRARAL